LQQNSKTATNQQNKNQMKNKKALYIIVGGVVLAITAAFLYFKKQATTLMNGITYKFQNVRFPKISLQEVQIAADLVINNPSDLTLTVTGYDMVAELYTYSNAGDAEPQSKTPLAHLVGKDINTDIPKLNSGVFPVTIKFKPQDLGFALAPVVLSMLSTASEQASTGVDNTNREFAIHYRGLFSGKLGAFGVSNVPVDYTYNL
jgi:hypothetical protein